MREGDDLTAGLDGALLAHIDRIVEERVAGAIAELLKGEELRDRITGVASTVRLRRHVVMGPRSRLVVHPTARIKGAVFNTASGRIVVAEEAMVAPEARLLTGTHDVDLLGAERMDAVPKSGRDIVVERGAWIASAATVIGPCVIGEHAVVAAGAVVTRDVPSYAIVAGNPARPLGTVGPEGVRPPRSNRQPSGSDQR
jgi:acetyltransferase-like isoleucine patch superfamily enzyme